MAFITENSVTTSFAEYDDVVTADQRLFEANEGLADDIIESFLVRSTERILTQIRNTDWWRDLYLQKTANPVYSSPTDLPEVNPSLILRRHNDFTDLCVYYAMWNYILPKIADFSREDNAERAKIGFYTGKYQTLFDELINSGDWYDLNADGIVSAKEKLAGNQSLKRIR
jgi:hypothetical protein